MVQRSLERVREQQGDEEEAESEEEEEDRGGGIMECLNNLNIETAGTEGEAAEGLAAALGMSNQEMEVEGDRGSED